MFKNNQNVIKPNNANHMNIPLASVYPHNTDTTVNASPVNIAITQPIIENNFLDIIVCTGPCRAQLLNNNN